ncbi:hypothetical protein SAMN05421772_1278 [Paracoccus saliphilus]|uniref:Uncharacterized protein n=1 Tax=Paracoccus saliphilus TaxID=405559 RepID=A0AA46A7M6_9RHOB|nr:hypothetical protein SAMN05421772_1278 [Paracoccus saliphilus]
MKPALLVAAIFGIGLAVDYLDSISADTSDWCSQWERTYGECG